MNAGRPARHGGRTGALTALLAALLAAALLAAPPAATASEVDLQLVLAVDASGSVDEAEYRLQLDGIATAFRDPAVQAAVAAGPLGRIAVTLVVWSEANRPKDGLDWHLLSGPGDAEAFARALERFPRRIPAGGTGIGKALQFAVWRIERSGYRSARKTIDLSGDGRETAFHDWSIDIGHGRQLAAAHGIAVNALAILSDDPDLDRYFERHLIAGPAAFVLAVEDFAGFAAAMRRKLLREIDDRPVIGMRPPDGPSRDAPAPGPS